MLTGPYDFIREKTSKRQRKLRSHDTSKIIACKNCGSTNNTLYHIDDGYMCIKCYKKEENK